MEVSFGMIAAYTLCIVVELALPGHTVTFAAGGIIGSLAYILYDMKKG